MPHDDFQTLNAAYKQSNKETQAIVVCHSLPMFWSRPVATWGSCEPCPPLGPYIPALTIGRAMAETDR